MQLTRKKLEGKIAKELSKSILITSAYIDSERTKDDYYDDKQTGTEYVFFFDAAENQYRIVSTNGVIFTTSAVQEAVDHWNSIEIRS
jgi:hypothetical protein